MIEARIAKVVMVASLALFAFIVAFDNITDYDTNFEFVRHVLSMDAISPGSTLLYRRVMSPALWNFAYWLIIIGEGITSLVLGIAAVVLLRRLRSDGARFNYAKRFVFIGATLGFLVWFFGFMVVGGEWFQMWQSQKWNGQEAAFRFYLTIPRRPDLCEPGRRRSPEGFMIAHVSIGVRDVDRSRRFYGAVLEPLGYKCIRPARKLTGYGYGRDSIAFWVVPAERPVPADEKSGLHFCFRGSSAEAVDAFHAAALRSGGHYNGAPGLRPEYGPDYYAAFIIDPDGYRIEAYYGPGES